jgi:hypothetical protein
MAGAAVVFASPRKPIQDRRDCLSVVWDDPSAPTAGGAGRSPSAAISIAVVAPSGVSESLLQRIFEEAQAIWEPIGVALDWRISSKETARESQLAVMLDPTHDRSPTWRAPLGWIGFEGGTPDRSIHLSQAAAEELIRRTPSALDATLGTHEILVGRALGRALSHELGHYLLQSKAHTPRGLMRADWPSEEFLSVNRSGFQLTHEQLDAAARQLRHETGDQL